jgi:hypothetical protein
LEGALNPFITYQSINKVYSKMNLKEKRKITAKKEKNVMIL